VEPCKQYRSTVEFNFVDSTVLINLGDPCKRAFYTPSRELDGRRSDICAVAQYVTFRGCDFTEVK